MDDIDHDLHAGLPPIPITILTGFLGAGKTTRLNRILNGDHGLRAAVLINDFGSITIDADLVVGVDGNVISLANGCICCTIRDDLIDTVMATIDRPEQPERILLEASGVAEPSGIAVTLTSPTFRDRLRLDSILCRVDAEQLCVVPELMELKIWQIACADMVILNKVDLVDRAQIDKISGWLDSRLHRYRLVEARHGDVPLPILLSVGRFDPAQLDLTLQDLAQGGCSAPTCDFRSLLADIPSRSLLYRMYGKASRSAKQVYIGSVTTESGFVASEFGDRILAFRHAWGSKGSSVGIEANTHQERKTNHET
jgi:G3E family GTPase